MSTYKSAMKGVPVILQDAGTIAANGVAISIPSSFRQHKVTIKGIGGVNAGAIQIETANDPAYTGTWNPLGGGPITVVDVSEIEYNFEGIYSAIRARISTGIGVGTVTVTYVGS